MKIILSKLPPTEQVSEIHRNVCRYCPSAHYPPDPECIDIKETWSRREQVESVFGCGWRQHKACKGYCDYLGVTADELKQHRSVQP